MKKTSIFATVTALAALVIYLLTSLTGFMAGKAMNIWPVVLTVVAIVLLFAADKMKKPSALKDIVIVLTGFALIGCISFFAMERVKLAADVWFIPGVVLEVTAADISLSPIHTIAYGTVKEDAGLGLRFPRFTGRVRDDKTPEQCTTASEIVEFYRMQEDRDNGDVE